MGLSKFRATQRMLSASKSTIRGGKGMSGKRAITGDKEIDALLKNLEVKVANKFVRQGLRRVAKDIVLPDAKRQAPVDTGQLEKSLTVRAGRRSRTGPSYTVVSRPRGGVDQAHYAWSVEFGTKHMQADPFLRPALYGNRDAITKLLSDDLWDQITREAIVRKGRLRASKLGL